MKRTLHGAIVILFRMALCAALLFGALLTLGQLAGAIALRPEWVTASDRLFFLPAMVATASFGLLAFVGSYFGPDSKPDLVDEED